MLLVPWCDASTLPFQEERRGRRVRSERWISPAGRVRWITSLDRREADVYAAAATLAVPRTPSSPRVFGIPAGPGRPWQEERRAWRRAVRDATAVADLVIVADVQDCYPSAGERAIRMASLRAGGEVGPLLAQLARFQATGIRGLPIGPVPSASLADAVLAIADERARQAGAAPIRWVDDVLFAGDRAAVQRAARAWVRALGELGLVENETKRRSLRADDETLRGILAATSLPRRGRRDIIRRS